MNKVTKLLCTLALTFTSLVASATLNPPSNPYGWVAPPNNQTDIDLQTYYISTYDGTNRLLDVWFYNSTEHLGFVKRQYTEASSNYGKQHWFMHSNKTKIGYSYYQTDGSIGNKIMCPDGHSTTIKRHINILTQTFPNWVYLPIDVGTNVGKPCGYVAPANKTDIVTIQNLYGSNYTVTRLYATRDIFKVQCTVSPYCDVYNGAGAYVPGNQTFYLSNTQRIAYKYPNVQMPETYARTTDTLSDPVAQDNVNYLVANYFGGYVVWVNYYSNPVYTSWFN